MSEQLSAFQWVKGDPFRTHKVLCAVSGLGLDWRLTAAVTSPEKLSILDYLFFFFAYIYIYPLKLIQGLI